MSWQVVGWVDYIADEAELLITELVTMQFTALRRAQADETAYAELYAAVFGDYDARGFVFRPAEEVAAGITRLIREMGLFVLADDIAALAHLKRHVFWTASLPAVRMARPGVYTPSRQQQQKNRQAFEDLVHRAGAIAYAERLPSLPIGPAAEAEALRRQVIEIFDQVIAEAGRRNDGTQRTLRQLLALTLQLIAHRAVAPQEEEVLQLSAPMPSLVCAHWAYREARQAQRIRDANPTAHPNFMPLRISVPAWP